MKRCLAIPLFILCNVFAFADNYSTDNYRPTIDTVTIGKTSLPIVFIDTQYGTDSKHAIHKDYRIAVRMKIIDNADGVNYGDTTAHPNQHADYEGWVAIRYRGNSSFNISLKKPFSFKTMLTADVEGEKLKVSLMGMPKDHDWILLAPFTDRSMIRDALMFQLSRPFFDYTPRVRHCELVLDGVYYGIYVLTEKIRKGKNRLNLDDPGNEGDELTGGYHLQIDRNDEPHYYTSTFPAVDSLGRKYSMYNRIYFQYKHPEYDEMTPEQLDYINNQINSMETALASDDFADQENGYRKYMDTMSFIDQQLSQEVSCNVDAYRLSTAIYKHRDSQDGRFKTALWDFNLAFGNCNFAGETRTDFWRYQNSFFTATNCINKVPFWWMRLMEDSAYVNQLKMRWVEYRKTAYSLKHLDATIDSLANNLVSSGAIERNYTVWKVWNKELWAVPNPMTVNTYDKEIAWLKDWLHERIAWMDEQLEFDKYRIISLERNIDAYYIERNIDAYYNLKGMRLKALPRQGIVIMRFKDGSKRKVIMRQR